MKRLMVVVAALAGVVLPARADRTNVTSAAELVAVLEKWNLDGNSSHVITLAKGSYDVSAFRMQGYDPNGKKYVSAYGHVALTRLTLRGETDNPRDTVIYGNGQDGETSSDYLIYMWQGKLQHLTVSNGCSSAASGGGVCCMNSVTVNTNVIVTCCKAQNGGGIYSGVWNNCQVIGNESTGSGGGVYRSKMVGGVVCCNASRNEAGGGAYKADLYDVVVSNNTANTHGGGVYNPADNNGTTYGVSNCVIVCNSANSHGGGVRNGIVRDSLVCGNEAPSNGGGCHEATVYGSVLCGNTAANGGGFCGGTLCDSSVVSNRVTGAGGGGYTGTSTNCLVACNFSSGTSGGLYSGTHTGAVVSNNLGRCNGGGAYGATFYDSWIGFNICSNWSTASDDRTYGGGLNGGSASNCVVVGNAIPNCPNTYRQGAGGYNTAFTDCLIANNFVYGGAGAAINSGSAVRCVISNNVGSTGADCVRQLKAPYLVDCDVYEGTLDVQGPMVNCRVMNYTNGNVLAVGDNVVACGHYKGSDYLTANRLFATNCLFANNRVNTLFRPAKAPFELVNCTVAGNHASATFFDEKDTSPAQAVNTLFCGNFQLNSDQPRDFWYSTDSEKYTNQAIVVTNCLISTYRTTTPLSDEYGTVTNNNARFDTTNPEHPYSLRHASPARGRGLAMDWMTDATDVRRSAEFPRLSENGKVDIGCYQCWLPPVGALLLVR